MSGKETVVLETVLENLNRPNQEGDTIAPIKPLEQSDDEVYNSLHSVLKTDDETNKINKNKE